MADQHDDEQPQYTLYRTRPKLFGRRDDVEVLPRPDERPGPEEPRPPRRRRRLRPGRIVAYLALALVGWVLVSLVLFLVSAQIQSSKISDAAWLPRRGYYSRQIRTRQLAMSCFGLFRIHRLPRR